MFRATGRKKRRGQAMVEFALIFPILILVTYSIIELGRFMFIYASVSAAAREASRYGAAAGHIDPDDDSSPYYFEDCEGIKNTARRVAQFITLNDIAIEYDHGSDSSVFASSCPPSAPDDIKTGDRVHVTVSATYTPILFFNGLFTNDVTIKADSAHTIVRNVPVP